MGAVIDYYLSSAPVEPITLEIANGHGQILHRATSVKRDTVAMAAQNPAVAGFSNSPLSARPGMNRYLWNFREVGPSTVPGMTILELQNGGGPLLPPGAYQIKLAVGGKEYTAPLEVKVDSRVSASQTDLERQYEFSVKIRNRITEVHNTVNEIREARSSLEKARNKLNSDALQMLVTLEQKMADIEAQLIQVKSVNRWASLVYPIMLDAQYADLANAVESADAAPAAQIYEVFEDYERKREDLLARWKALTTEIDAFRSK
jgi:hypothetical protein